MDSDDEQDWEEVQVPEQQQHLEITLNARPKAKGPSKSVKFYKMPPNFSSCLQKEIGNLSCRAHAQDRLP